METSIKHFVIDRHEKKKLWYRVNNKRTVFDWTSNESIISVHTDAKQYLYCTFPIEVRRVTIIVSFFVVVIIVHCYTGVSYRFLR